MKKKLFAFIILGIMLGGCTSKQTQTGFPSPPEGANLKDAAFTCENYNYDISSGAFDSGMVFQIVTRNHVDSNQIEVSIPVKSPYEIFINEQDIAKNFGELDVCETTKTDYGESLLVPVPNSSGFSAYLYQSYRGLDWTKLSEAENKLTTLKEKRQSDDLNDTERDNLDTQIKETIKQIDDCRTMFIEDYVKLTPDMLPKFYLYTVQIYFDPAQMKSESFQNISIQLGDEQYNVTIGEIRLHAPEVDQKAEESLGNSPLKFQMGAAIGLDSLPYHPGPVYVETELYYAEDDVVLQSMETVKELSGSAVLAGIKVNLSESKTFDQVIEIQWDGKSKITVPKGKYMKMVLTVEDDRMKAPYYGGQIYTKLDINWENQEFSETSGYSLTRDNFTPWVYYTMGLDGVDLSGYYRYAGQM